MVKLDIFFFFLFVLASVHITNLILNIIKNILSSDPQTMNYSLLEKISNYFFITYFITYLISAH